MWQNPIMYKGLTPGAYSEVTPFVFKNRLYRVENFKRCEDFPGRPATYRFHEDGFRIRDIEADRILSVPLLNHYFAVAYVWDNRVYIFTGDYGENLPWWNIRQTHMICSDDLITWTKPQAVLTAEGGEHLFNYGICHARNQFYMLYETDDERWPKFTFRFCVSEDLIHWQRLPVEAIYGSDRYVGAPALYFEDDWFYCMYAGDAGGKWDTRISRSKDLIHWQDAPTDRLVIPVRNDLYVNPVQFPDVHEISASDAELCEFKGQTYIYWNGSDQASCGNLQWGLFDGSPKKLFEKFFE